MQHNWKQEHEYSVNCWYIIDANKKNKDKDIIIHVNYIYSSFFLFLNNKYRQHDVLSIFHSFI